jgi:membrane protease YdiL (CAAX protease family)
MSASGIVSLIRSIYSKCSGVQSAQRSAPYCRAIASMTSRRKSPPLRHLDTTHASISSAFKSVLVNSLSAVPAGILMVVGVVLIYSVVFPAFHLQMNTGVANRLAAMPFWYRFMLVTRAAVAEETLFRGYPIERLEELTASLALAGFVSWAAFAIAHLGAWGWPQLMVAGFGGAILTILYLWRRNLWLNMIAHWIVDGTGFLLPH